MNQSDFDNFGDLLTSTAEMYSKNIKPTQTAMYFRALAQYPIEAIQAAIDGHVCSAERGRFMPLPADLIAQLETMRFDGRPSAEEAWSVAVQSVDEDFTVTWTQETQEAWVASARELMAIGDKFNASRGFIGKYNDLVAIARRKGLPVVWNVSLGNNKDMREQAVRDAYQAKRITKAQAAVLLPYHQAVEGTFERIQNNVSLMIENKGATNDHKTLSRIDELKTSGELHQKRISELRKAIGVEQPIKKRNAFECLAVFEQAESKKVFIDAEDKKHWLVVAGNGGDMSQLKMRMLGNRGAA